MEMINSKFRMLVTSWEEFIGKKLKRDPGRFYDDYDIYR